ncbi:MAG: 2-amino-4-hydroxy-6-hydroxymethyldihydropteridine diphosphokinase [Candidatus Neomarinimicrobiota bacterium]
MSKLAYLSLGSNIGDRETNLVSAITILGNYAEIENIKSATFYETEPLYNTDQPSFLNTVISLETSFTPFQLLDAVRDTETLLGRPKDREKNDPRSIDIDILCFDDVFIETEELTIPHPDLHNRRFVLTPFEELAPNFVIKRLKMSVRDLLKICQDRSKIRKHKIISNA